MNYVWIDAENADDFVSVLPRDLTLADYNICIGIVDDKEYICGAICYRYNLYQYDVLWLYVVPQKRRQGIGSRLMDIVFRMIRRSGDIYPISAMFEVGEGDSLYPFFLGYGKMDVSYSHDRYILKPKEIFGALFPPEAAQQTLKQTKFFSLPENKQKGILAFLKTEEYYAPDDYDNWKRTIVPELCKCILVGDELKNLVFVHRMPGGDLELSYVYSKNPRGLAEILISTSWDIEEMYPDSKVCFDAVSERAETLAKKLFPKVSTVHIYEAQW